jgi:hypothetical protein
MEMRPPDLMIADTANPDLIRVWDVASFHLIQIRCDGLRQEELSLLAGEAVTRCLRRQSPQRGLPVLWYS